MEKRHNFKTYAEAVADVGAFDVHVGNSRTVQLVGNGAQLRKVRGCLHHPSDGWSSSKQPGCRARGMEQQAMGLRMHCIIIPPECPCANLAQA